MMATNAMSPGTPKSKRPKCVKDLGFDTTTCNGQNAFEPPSDIEIEAKTSTPTEFKFTQEPTLEQIRVMQNNFSKERDFDKFHSPRNLLLAMVGEVGEVAELFQWKGEVKDGLPDWTEKEKENLSQELSDVLIYLVRLSEKCHIDLPSATVEKIGLNHKKYPADKVHGSCKKYNEYD
ncbi:dCTP pyrophosphatase 1-like [Saccoglossus kowalevskii]|uniref:dCTP pyrophosphatase 1-like n=1 Tax=Saccoglossus kowalevskii TaxID=10224 RepID=A0ABM0H1W0_SACKO|nr:PREDICTED: dCTP pyrophosphatase 1-like [Saccoglossus kowalevskii]